MWWWSSDRFQSFQLGCNAGNIRAVSSHGGLRHGWGPVSFCSLMHRILVNLIVIYSLRASYFSHPMLQSVIFWTWHSQSTSLFNSGSFCWHTYMLHVHVAVSKQHNMVLAGGQWCSEDNRGSGIILSILHWLTGVSVYRQSRLTVTWVCMLCSAGV